MLSHHSLSLKRESCSDSLLFSRSNQLKNSSQLWDSGNDKRNPRFLYLTHYITKESQWIYGCYDPHGVQEERRLQSIEKEERRDFGVGRKEEVGKKAGIFLEVQAKRKEEEKVWVIDVAKIERSVDDSRQSVALVASLKACAKEKDLHAGRRVHAVVIKLGLLANVFIGSSLLSMYAKCDALDKAREVFHELPCRSVVLWTALISAYALYDYGVEAINFYEQMQLEGFSPNAITFICILKACASIGALDKGCEIHAQIVKQHLLEKDIMVANALIDMYAKCGALQKAQDVFDAVRFRNVVSWNALIAGYAQHGHGEGALNCLESMQHGGFSPNAVTFVCGLKACGNIGALDKGQEIHDQLVKDHLMEDNIVVANSLIDMYAKCGALQKAQGVFDELRVRDIVSWNALLGGYAQHGHGDEALKCYRRMQLEGFVPDAVTFVCVLNACTSIGALEKGQEIHAQIAREHLLERNNVVVANAIVDLYGKCGALEKAQETFDELPNRNVVSWNALIAGYALHGRSEEALNHFELMQLEGYSPNAATFVCMLKACGSIGASKRGRAVHAQIVKAGLLEEDIVLANALVDMYAKGGSQLEAQDVFDKLLFRDVVSWNALILGYAQHKYIEDALIYFERMQLEGFCPDVATLACVMKACSGSGAANKGQEIHGVIVKHGFLEKDLVVGTGLVDMYANLGMLVEAQAVFDKLRVRNVVTWSALMEGYAQLGKDEIVFNLFDEMIQEGTKPDSVTFTIVLNICSHRGLLDKIPEITSKCYGIIPTLESHTCIVDLLGRAGHLDKAVAVIEGMPLSANLPLWHTLLGACQTWGNIKLGRWAFEKAVRLDEMDATAYVCMRNIYSAAGRKEDADAIEALRVQKQTRRDLEYG